MNTEIKIGIVEDELLIAEKIKRLLMNMDYKVCEPVSSYEEALAMIETEKPDLLLLDINLNTKKDGIDVAAKVNELYQLPFIFLTANSDALTVERAKNVKPNAYLVKPFKKEELIIAIEIAFNNYQNEKTNPVKTFPHPIAKDFIFIKENQRFVKILFSDIVYIESYENYVQIFTRDKRKNLVRATFTDFLAQLPTDRFFRTHRSFAVQLNLVENIEPTEVFACDYKIPISNTYRADLFKALGIRD